MASINIEALKAERAALAAANESATGWGAAVGARHERIKEIDRTLALAPTPSLTNPNPKREDEREAIAELLHDERGEKTRKHDYWVIVGLTPEDEWGNRSSRVIDRSQDCKDRDVCVEILTEDDGDRLLWTKDRPAGLYKLQVHPYGDGDSYDLNVVSAELLYPLSASARPSPGDPVRAAISEAQLHAAMDAFYPGENWRVDLGCALDSSLRDMKSALRTALSASAPTGEGEVLRGLGEKFDKEALASDLYEEAHRFDRNARRLVWLDAQADLHRSCTAYVRERLAALAYPPQGGERDANLPVQWRWVNVYPFKGRWEYLIERSDFTRNAGSARTEEDARKEAINSANRHEDRLARHLISPAPTSPSKSSEDESEKLWCESCGEAEQTVHLEYAGLCGECAKQHGDES